MGGQVGLDLGDTKHATCVLNQGGVISVERLPWGYPKRSEQARPRTSGKK